MGTGGATVEAYRGLTGELGGDGCFALESFFCSRSQKAGLVISFKMRFSSFGDPLLFFVLSICELSDRTPITFRMHGQGSFVEHSRRFF